MAAKLRRARTSRDNANTDAEPKATMKTWTRTAYCMVRRNTAGNASRSSCPFGYTLEYRFWVVSTNRPVITHMSGEMRWYALAS